MTTATEDTTRAAVDRLVASATTQGFPPKVTDPAALARVAAVIRGGRS